MKQAIARRERLYEVLIAYLVSGLIGTIWETIYVDVLFGVDVVRYIFVLPIAIMFAWGGVILYLVYRHVDFCAKTIPFIFVSSLILMNAFELMMGIFLNAIGLEIWNYSDTGNPLKDYITIHSGIAWGILSLLFVYLMPKLYKTLKRITIQKLYIVISCVILLSALNLVRMSMLSDYLLLCLALLFATMIVLMIGYFIIKRNLSTFNAVILTICVIDLIFSIIHGYQDPVFMERMVHPWT